jgi:hypothetical protein
MQSPLQNLYSKAFTFSVVNASPLEVVQVLCKYLEQIGCSDCRPSEVAETPFAWLETVTVIVDLIPLLVEFKVEENQGKVIVTMNDMSLNDVIRRTRLCDDILRHLNGKGFSATCMQRLQQCFRLLDDDFDLIIESEMQSCSEQFDINLVDIDACKCHLYEEAPQVVSLQPSSEQIDMNIVDIDTCKRDMHEEALPVVSLQACGKQIDTNFVDSDACKRDLFEEALQPFSCWSPSKTESGNPLMKGLAKTTMSLSALVHLASLLDSHPAFAL